MKKVKGKASPGRISSVKQGQDACIAFGKGERMEGKSSIPPKSSGETGKDNHKKGELAEDNK